MPNAEMVAMLQNLMALTGATTGTAIKKAVDELVASEKIDVDSIKSKIEVIQHILDADPSTPEFDQAKNIITSLKNILSRLEAVENAITALNGDKTVSGSVDFKIAAEKARADAAEKANAACCATNAGKLDEQVKAFDKHVSDATAELKKQADAISANAKAVTDETTRAQNAEDAINGAISNIQNELKVSEDDAKSLQGIVTAALTGAGLNQDGTFTPDTAKTDADNVYAYIQDSSAEGADRANTLHKALRRLAKQAQMSDKAMDARLDTLEGDAKTEGSILNAITTAVTKEANRAQAAEKELTDKVNANKEEADKAKTSLQSQIDDLTGGSENSVKSVSDKVSKTQAGAGLEKDGSYAPDTKANYINEATSLKDADTKLDAKLKELEDKKADASKSVMSSDIAAIDYHALAKVFADALQSGLAKNKSDKTTDSKHAKKDSKDDNGDGAVV